MKKNKVCPKCASTEVYNNSQRRTKGHRSYITINAWAGLSIDSYICLECGYIEEYLSEKHLQNLKRMTKIKKTWQKG
jgi:predicted nucleic-acid-binding Zn-ribbon protein